MGIKRFDIDDVEMRKSAMSVRDSKGCIPHPQNQKRQNTGNPNAMTGTRGSMSVVSSAPPTEKGQDANRRTWKTPLHWKHEPMHSKGKAIRNPKSPDACTAKTYTRNNEGAARK